MFPEFVDYFSVNKKTVSASLYEKAIPALSDFGEKRLALMDDNGIDFVVLSLSGPGVQIEPDTGVAVKLARLANEKLAKEVQRKPERYGGFAHLAMQDPQGAADELERCMRDYGFQGAMINGQTGGVYLDDRRYDVFWERVSALRAPIYLHPADPFDKPAMYADHPEMWGPTWSWAVETGSHALRLVFSGVFDRYPDVPLILGHMGENLPIQLWRFDSRYEVSNKRHAIAKAPSDYIRSNIKITTSGVCSDVALRCTLDAIGPENVMFSIDYPMESTEIASKWISGAAISDEERRLVSHANAERILALGGAERTAAAGGDHG
ncbi:amidohydrolase [Sphingomonas sp. CGMCC 1.13654]|uniref:Amidohydrolase n=2 Tax=Sphingomonas chungangi TaxID=2683589 RepID=A0A838L2A2_9SPHN|nr:amidohydrolase family protein [Sphingomonas chungangi]MBA2933511.1 amidohydrolase [Sphingomonas chungangi]MVW54844.1 amidohydrolase family protein [Sphingomonas chungangi]